MNRGAGVDPERKTTLLKDVAAVAADIEKFLVRLATRGCPRPRAGLLTIPVSALRCCDWKKTASWWLHAGQLRVALGS